MNVESGQSVARYRFVEKLGEGGMGVVWRAIDTRLDRDVAIKILPEEFARDPDRLARFEREARLLASLNNANIAAIYGFEHTDGLHYLVLEYVPGATLEERLCGGALPLEEALDLCRQIAGALAAAHRRGVVHRDLKPANVKITPDGRIKVLDFGLAKALEPETGADLGQSQSPTVTRHMTEAGMILGTAGYMSPEQARGKPVDKRTDIWAFGCLLFQCLTGREPFRGETVADTLGAILHKEPDWSVLPATTPASTRRLCVRCLQKDAARRLHDIDDARLEIEDILALRDSTPSGYLATDSFTGTTSRRSPVVLGAAAAIVVGLAGLATGFWLRGAAPSAQAERPVTRFAVAPGVDASFPIVAADGRTLAWAVREDSLQGTVTRLYTRRLDGFEEKPVPRSEDVVAHTFSPDGRWLAFVAPFEPGSRTLRLAKVPADGSTPPLAVADWPVDTSPGIAWLQGGDIVGVTTAPQTIVRVPADGDPTADPVPVQAGDFKGEYIVVGALPRDPFLLAAAGAWVESGLRWSVAVLDASSGEARIVVEDGTIADWSPSGHLLFTRRDTLLAVPFDLRALRVTGGPVTLLDGLLTVDAAVGGWFDLSPNGTLVYQPGGVQGTNRRLVLADAEGRVTAWAAERRAFGDSLAVSADGRRLAATVAHADGRGEIWGSDVAEPLLRPLVGGADLDCGSPAWSADGTTLFYGCVDEDKAGTVHALDPGTPDGPRQLLAADASGVLLDPTSASTDGRWLLVERLAEDRSILLVNLDAAGVSSAARVLSLERDEPGEPRFSPDGRWIAYTALESGRREIFARRFDDGVLGREITVSTTGGMRPAWSPPEAGGGLQLIFESDAGRMLAVPFRDGTAGRTRQLLDLTRLRADGMGLQALPDGRFLLVERGPEEDGGAIHVVLDWLDELRGRVGP